MELDNEFEVGVSVAEAWAVLTDVERIAPCMPGAELREIEGDQYRGVVKIKVGPISAEYRGAARFVEKDEDSHRVVLRAEGREARGQGNANATITASLAPQGSATKVSVKTDLQITGKVAQFGRGVLADVSNKLLGQFVDNLENTVLKIDSDALRAGTTSAQVPEPASGDASADGATIRHLQPQSAEPVDLLEVAGAPVARRIAPVLGGALAFVVALALLRRLFGRARR